LGVLAGCRRDWDAAERHFAAATELNDRLRMPTWRARSRHDHARMLLSRGAPGDAARARDLLGQARRDAVRHRLAGLWQSIDTLLRDGAGPGGPPLPDGLTQREADVLRLVARGHSNRAIGRALFISPNTAANHVRSILMKTGCANRTEAAAFAHRHGLAGEH
ncbi:MAG TPA: LuxR C-terminal-related transcriptional regulator, partial [Pseudonocardia sp.]|nr:LuxR C-terminal-related transcriptional regulator [Pseudonocardia sp.]